MPIRRQPNRQRSSILAAGLGLCLLMAGPSIANAASPSTSTPAASADFQGRPASREARQVVDWIMATRDNHAMPFVIVDKKAAMVLVFDGAGRLIGDTPALLGLARGDDSAPGVGDRELSQIRPEERTTPAGRFVASLGQALGPKDVLWVDYGAALSLHRVLSANTREHRLQRLAAASPLDHRITFGCINVPVRFYDQVVHPTFTGTSGVVYILPEVRSIPEVFFASASTSASASASASAS